MPRRRASARATPCSTNAGLPEASRACEHEAVWLDENIFRAGREGVDDAVRAIRKVQERVEELNRETGHG